MEGLPFVGEGVLTDAGGAAWRVTHADGGRTFAEGQEPVAKEVRAPLPPRASGGAVRAAAAREGSNMTVTRAG